MSCPLAIVAMDVLIDDQTGLDRLDQSVYDGQSLVSEQNEEHKITEQRFSALLQGVVAAAELNANDIPLIMIAEESDAKGHDNVSGFSKVQWVPSLDAALALAQSNIQDGTVASDTVLIASTYSACGQPSTSAPIASLSFDASSDLSQQTYAESSVAAAIVLSGNERARETAYANIAGVGVANDTTHACAEAFAVAGVQASDIEYIDVTASDNTDHAQRELLGLVEAYGQDNKALTCALGAAVNTSGKCGAVQGLVSLIRASLSLHHRYIPMVPDWEAPADAQAWENSPFYVATESTHWFENKSIGGRRSSVNVMGLDSVCHVVLKENPDNTHRENTYFSRVTWCFFPIAANNYEAMAAKLHTLQADIAAASDLKSLALEYFNQHTRDQLTTSHSLVVLGESKAVLDSEVELMLAGLQVAFESNAERKTPKGSFFTSTPVGADAEVAFVYPGIGAPYVDFGRDLFHLFPDACDSLHRMSRDAGKSVKHDLLYPRARHRLSPKQKKQVEKELKVNLHKISECGVGMGYLLTKAFRDQFKLEPNAGVGYSMGEVSMYVALDAWSDPGCLSEPLADHPTFKHNITGELYALKDYWGLPKSDESGTTLWNTYSLRGDPEEVARVVDEEEKVYLTIINTPDNMLIGGDPEGCQRVVKKLGTRAMSLELASAIHSAPAKAEYDRIVDLYSIDVNERSDVRYYSTSVYKAVPHRTKAIANSIAKSFTEPVDFPRLIQEMVDSGVRVFVEMGADRSCSTWIDKILKQGDDAVPHVCVPVNARGTDDHITIVRALAKLVSHRVNIDISSLYGQ